MADHIRWGVLGAANFARAHMAPALHAAPGGSLEALATRDPAKAAPFLDAFPGLRVMDSYEALIEDEGIDAVYIPLPNHLHVEWTRRAAEAGKHVLCEKPIALHAAQIDELIALRERTGRLIAEAYMIVHHPQWHHAKALYEAGELGDLVMVDGVFSFDNREDVQNIRNRAETGGGGLRDIGVYTFGAARFVTGEEPERLLGAVIDWDRGVDVWAQVLAQFPSFRYSSVTSMRMAPRQDMVFHGTRGVMRLSAPFNPRVYGESCLRLERSDKTAEEARFPLADQYALQVAAFNRSARSGVPYPCPLEFSRGTQAMIDRVFETAERQARE